MLSEKLVALIDRERLPLEYREIVNRFHVPIADKVAARRAEAGKCLTVGICGPQGSGKTTLALFLETILEDRGLHVARISLDDLYLARARRKALARTVHHLLLTRGVPGTHDVELGISLLNGLSCAQPGEQTLIPRFDKAVDDRAPEAGWDSFKGSADVILFEGWCVGARPEPEEALSAPVNELERVEDAEEKWRRYVNGELAGPYAELFGRIDCLVLILPPGFECVRRWRALQERKLRERAGAAAARVMSELEIERFIMHFERITRHIMKEMPSRADLIVEIDADQSPVTLRDGSV